VTRPRPSAPRTLLALAAAAALAHPAGGAAQVRSELSAGAGVLERGPAASSALLLGGVLEARAPHAILRAAGSTARFTDGGADAEGSLSALLRTGRLGGLVSGEVVGTARQLSYRGFDERWRVDVAAGPRLTLGGTSVRARGEISLYSDGVRPRDAVSADLYVRHEVGRAFVTFSASRMAFAERAVVFRDTVFYVGGFPFRSRSQSIEDRSRAYTDLEAGLYIPVLRGDLELSAGRRSGELESPGAMWGRVAAAVPLSRRMAMVAEAGSRASTPEERLPAGRFFSVGMRLLGDDGPRRHFAPPPAPPGAPALELVPAPEGARTLRLTGVDGRQVALLADFTDWSPVEMARTPAGEWELTLVLAPGSYRLCVRADGGACLPPPGLPTVEDEFGGHVGILLVN
jgi:hypothetical protein